jgi:hypothetical protein
MVQEFQGYLYGIGRLPPAPAIGLVGCGYAAEAPAVETLTVQARVDDPAFTREQV